MIRSADTTKDAAIKQLEVLQNLGPAGRLKLTMDLCDTLRNITKAGIRHRHPHYTEQQVAQAYLKLILDKTLFDEIFPGCEISA